MRSFAPPLLINNAFFLRSRSLSTILTEYTVHQSKNTLSDYGASRRQQRIARVIIMSTRSSSSTRTMKTDTSVPTETSSPPMILGGDYAGLHATFSSDTGELVPIPHHLVPRSMIEWGDVPNCFETLVSEDWLSSCTDNDDDNGRKGGKWSISRTILAVMPEVGCGIDNLEILKKVDNVSKSNSICRLFSWQLTTNDIPKKEQQQREMTIIDRTYDRKTVLELETIFQLDDNSSPQKDDSLSSLGPRRVRVSLSLTLPQEEEDKENKKQHCNNDIKISKLIDIRMERRISNSAESTKGEVWTGPAYNSGGLDARTVYRAIGKDIKNGDVFAVKKGTKTGGNDGDDNKYYPWTVPTGHHLGGIWKQTILSPPSPSLVGDDTATFAEVLRSENDFICGKSSTTPSFVTFRLPQNIMIRYGNGILLPVNDTPNRPERHITCCWAIEISHISTIIREGKSYLHRTVSLRSFNNTTTTRVQQLMKDEEESNVLGNINCWVEEKEGNLYL